jgi:fibronectin type 3 domain-containing protein
MKNLIKSILLIGLVTLYSGCQNNLSTPGDKPKIDPNLPKVDATSIRTIQDIKSIALEWRSIDVAQAKGYYIVRRNMQTNEKFKRVHKVQNKYSSHYLDGGLEPNSKYAYRISLIGNNGFESVASDQIIVSTLPNLKSVSLIETISNLPRQIKVLWRPHPNFRIEKYIIQRTSAANPKWETIATIEGRLNVEYIDKDLGDNETFSYRVKSVSFDDIVSDPSDISVATTKALPDQISALEATKDLPRKIQLSWGRSDTKDVVAYNIYRATSVNGSFSKIAQAQLNHNRYDDEVNEDGKIYFYKITTVDKDGLESDINGVSPVMGQTLTKPMMPNITLAQIQGNKIILNWNSYDDRVVSFNIYKTVKDGWITKKEKLIPNITGHRYEDHDVVRGVKYTYSLQAVDKNGLVSNKTDEVSSMLPKLQVKVPRK